MAIAYWCILVAAVLPYVWVFVAKSRKDYSNRNPRAWVAKHGDDYLIQRANNAHLNAFEAFAPFAAGVLMAQLAGVPARTIDLLAVAFVALRVLHGLFYIGDKPPLRSTVWGLGYLCVLALIVLAALRAG
jgi:uncharacterized MAPEG superfamily protein